ncbi:hypothetical protein FB446DRAFT_222594 [Lentinula raphanica]|nr:hypothetical protein FB446DRAFT_222594 [Lentinula raphanica]
MHPLSPPLSPTAVTSPTDQGLPDREPDFRTEDYFPFELAESDEEEEERVERSPTSDHPSAASTDEEHEDTESDESDENEELTSVPCESEMQITLPVYTPTPSSLAEALTPLASSESSQTFSTSVFALPVSAPSKTPESSPEVHRFVTRSPTPEETETFSPPPLTIPPPPLASIVPAQTRIHESDRFSETFQQEILPIYQADRVRELFQNDMPTTFSSSTCPSVLSAEIGRRAVNRLRTPYTRLLNYASRKLGSIGHGTPIDPNRRRNLIAWLEDRKIVQHASKPAISEACLQKDEEQLPPLGSAAWYATRYPSTLSSDPRSHSAARTLNPFVMSTSPITSSPQALLARNHPQLERPATFDANWPPLTVQPGELETFRDHHWGSKDYFGDGGVSDIMQNVEFQQGSSRGCGTDQTRYQYPQTVTSGNLNHVVTTQPNVDSIRDIPLAPSGFSPEIAMDENLSDEDAEGDIDPDVIQPVSVSGFSNSSSVDPTSSGSSLNAVVHRNDSYHTSSAGMNAFSALPLHVRSNEDVAYRSNAEFHDGSRMGMYGGTAVLNESVGHSFPNVEMPPSGSVPTRSFTDAGPASFPDSGIQGVGMNLNVSVGFGVSMGINRFGMDMMGVGVGLGMIGFPVVETDSWFLPASSPPASPIPLPTNTVEHHEHGVGGMSSFGNHPTYGDTLPDNARERFGSPGSPESAYPLGFAMG